MGLDIDTGIDIDTDRYMDILALLGLFFAFVYTHDKEEK